MMLRQLQTLILHQSQYCMQCFEIINVRASMFSMIIMPVHFPSKGIGLGIILIEPTFNDPISAPSALFNNFDICFD